MHYNNTNRGTIYVTTKRAMVYARIEIAADIQSNRRLTFSITNQNNL